MESNPGSFRKWLLNRQFGSELRSRRQWKEKSTNPKLLKGRLNLQMHPNDLPSRILYTVALIAIHTSILRRNWTSPRTWTDGISHEPTLLFSTFLSRRVGGYRHSMDVVTPSASTPADLPLDERDLCPGGSPELSVCPRTQSQAECGSSNAAPRVLYLLLSGSEWENFFSLRPIPGLWDTDRI